MTQTVPVTGVAQVGKDRVRVMTGLTTHAGGPYLCGPALTCACAPEDNLAMHAALYQAQPGAVLVCDGSGSTRCAMFGELMATDAANQRLPAWYCRARSGTSPTSTNSASRSGAPAPHRGRRPRPRWCRWACRWWSAAYWWPPATR